MVETFEVTRNFRTAQDLTVREFAEALNKSLVNTNVSFATVSRWEQERNYYEPDLRLLFECMATYRDWRSEWARDCLQSMFPDLFISGVIRVSLPSAE